MNINKYAACAIVNNDYSGMEEEEIKLIHDFLDRNKNLHIDFDNDLGFCRCRITGLYSDCVEGYTYEP